MTTMQPDRLDRIEALVEQNARAIADLKADHAQFKVDLKEQSKSWDDRYFQLTRDTLGTAKTIIVTAGTVVILSPLLQALSPAIQEIVSRFLAVSSQ